ncbi:MAG: hypothetical protein QF473_12980 [Planctomycetota bacterium]|nr:hypothetical protein [Planctomycetota bacterium]
MSVQDSFHGWVFEAQHFRFLQQTALFVRRDQDDCTGSLVSHGPARMFKTGFYDWRTAGLWH